MGHESDVATTLAQFGEQMLIPSAAVIFDCGEPGDGAYVVISGEICVLLLNEKGVPVWSRTVGPQSVLGLAAAIGKTPHQLRAVATGMAEIAFVESEKLAKLIVDNPIIGNSVLQLMSEEVTDVRRKAKMLNARIDRWTKAHGLN